MLRIMFFSVLVSVILLWGFFRAPLVSEAQIGVIQEATETAETAGSREFSEMTLKLIGKGCELLELKAAWLRLEGVIDVDIETKNSYAVVYYQATKVTETEIKGTVAKENKDCFIAVVPVPAKEVSD